MEGMEYISCVRFSMQLMIAESVFVIYWKKKDFFVGRFILALVGYFIMALSAFTVFRSIPGNNPVTYMSYYIALFVLTLMVMFFCFQVKKKEVLFAGVCGYATQHIAYAAYTIFHELTNLRLPAVWDFLLLRFFLYILAAVIVYCLLIRRYEGRGELVDKDMRMIVLALVILLTVIFISVLVDTGTFGDEAGILRNVLCKVYAIICSVLSIFIAFSLSWQNRITHENEMMETMLHNMGEQQKLSKETVNIINIKSHDLKYRISKIAKIEDDQEQKEYIEEIKKAVTIYDNIYQTGNSAMDLILTEKSLMCEENGIKVSSMVDGTLLNFMQTTDVYALFGNLLDNAIESVIQEENREKRIISIHVSRRNEGCHIHVENYCDKELVFENGLPVTTKRDKAYHGFGVKSIKYIVEKYQGDVLMHKADNRFRVDIMFY